jgi:dolichyl-phosphate-mannose-protein mannosyltransferase
VPTELFHQLLLTAVVCAPLPIVLALVADDLICSSRSVSLTDCWLGTLVLWTVTESLVVVSLGLSSHLFVAELLMAETVVVAVGMPMLIRRRGTVARWWRMSLDGLGRCSGAERWMLFVVTGLLVLLVLEEFGLPTGDYDSLAYQLPRVVEWYQQGTFLERPPQWAGWINSYPYGWNTLFFLMVAPLGHDQLALLPNLTAWLMLAVVTYGLARLGGGQRTGSLAAAVLLLLMPLSVINVHSAHNDLPFAVFFLGSLYFSLRAWQQRSGSLALLAAACAGMMLGCKMSGVGYIVLLLGIWCSLAAIGWRARRWRWSTILEPCRYPVLAVLCLGSVGLVGASWYLRNASENGNPLGFFQVSVFGWVILKGPVTRAFIDQTSLTGNFRLGDARHWAILARAIRQFPGCPGMMLAVGGAFLPFALFRRRNGRVILLALSTLCLATLWLYAAGPWTAKDGFEPDISDWMGQQMRYSFPFWGLLAAVVGATMPRPSGTLIPGIMMVGAAIGAVDAVRHSALYAEFSHRRATLLFAGALALASLAGTGLGRPPARRLVARLRSAWSRQPRAAVAAGIALVLLLTLSASAAMLIARGRRQAAQEARYGGIGRFIDEELEPRARVGFWGSHTSYLLYGRDLNRRLRYLALDQQPTWEDMARYVRSQPVDVVAVGPKVQPSPVWGWLADHPEAFVRIHGHHIFRDVVVYRVVHGSAR